MASSSSSALARRTQAALLLGFIAGAFFFYAPALTGPPISDDFFLFYNLYVQQPTPENLLAILDPRSQATLSLINYAPVRPLLQALLWKLSPENSLLYHSVNVALHGVAAFLLVRFLGALRVPLFAAALGGLYFLVHPANVEAVAWMCQVWSPLALIFSLLALLWLPRRPGLATAAFVLALLTKPMAVFSLPVAAALEWTRGAEPPGPERKGKATGPSRWPWILGWVAVCGLYVVAQAFTFLDSGQIHTPPLPVDVRFRFMAVLALRYLVMAATSWGLSAAQEPAIPRSWFDPWWLASLPVLGLLGVRLARTLRERRIEAAGWTFALAAFAPVSQIFPFLHPFADRYLYFMLPGLLAAGLLAGEEALQRVGDPSWRRRFQAVLFGLVIALCALFGYRTFVRAELWQSDDSVMQDAARHFPDGISGHLLRARERGQLGDADGEIRELRAAVDRGFLFTGSALRHPSFRRLREDPRYRPFFLELTRHTLDVIESKRRKTQLDFSEAEVWHELRGEIPEALDAVDRGLALGGPLDLVLRRDHDRLQALVTSSPAEPQRR